MRGTRCILGCICREYLADIMENTNIKILVIGNSASGKTTLSKELAQRIGLQHIHLDELFWSENWQPKDKEIFRHLVSKSIETSSWIVDGNYGSARDILWTQANYVIWLNYSLPCVLWRGLRRTLKRCLTRETLWHGNRESFSKLFSKDSLLKWIVQKHHSQIEAFKRIRDSEVYPNLIWIEFMSPSQTKSWLKHTTLPTRKNF